MQDNQSLKEAVAGELAKTSPIIFARLVERQVQEQLNSRVEAVADGLGQLDGARGKLKSLDRPDIIHHDKGGKIIHEGWTEGRLKELQKAKEAVQKWEQALDNAWGTPEKAPDFTLLRNLLKESKGSKPEPAKE